MELVIKTGSTIHGHAWKYAPTAASNFVVIPAAVIGGATGYYASKEGYIKGPSGRVYKGTARLSGYLEVNIQRRDFRVHRLVAAAHITNPADLPIVNHIDGDKQNNRVSNLEWTTAAGNSQHSYASGLNRIPEGRKIRRTHTTGEVKIFSSVREAARVCGGLKYSSNITACCGGRQKSAYGYTWQYV